MTAPADQKARRQALDPERSFIVQAPAGSGKTEILVQRYLGLLARVEEPDAVLAITFTRKAAAEMRARVASSLREAESAGGEVQPHRELTLKLARRVLEQSRRREWQLQENPARLRIITIDALGSWLAVSAPVSSGGGALGDLRADAKPLCESAARACLREGISKDDDDVQSLLRHLDGNGRQFTELVAGMLAKRESWLPLLGEEIDAQHLSRALRHLAGREIRWMLESLGECRSEFERMFAEHWAGDGEPNNPSDPDALPGWFRAGGDLLTQKDEWRARFKPKPAEQLERRLRESLEFRQRLARIRTLPSPDCNVQRAGQVRAVLGVLRQSLACLKLLFAQRGETDYAEVSQAAVRALGREDRSSLLAERLDARLRHILVDEFQDTSDTQFDLLERMIAEWQPDDGRTIFLVGDPMQSIYGFREADVRGYLRVCEQGLGNLRPEVLRLTVNFRSAPELADWFNRIFPKVFPVAGDMGMGTVPYTPCEAAPGAEPGQGSVGLHYFRKGEHESEVAIVERLVLETFSDHPGESIGILVRSRTHGEQVSHALQASHALRERGIGVSRTEFDRRKRYSVVQDLAAVARALAQRSDRIAWLAVLRAPWCGLSLKDMHALCHDARDDAVWDLMRDAERTARLSGDGRARLARVSSVLEQALRLRGQLDFRSWVEGAWLALGGPAGNADEQCLRHASEFLDSLEAASRGSLIDNAVLRTLNLTEEFVSNPETGALVQIMTMHKAKGLEFDTVILPGLGRGVSAGFAPVLRWWKPPRSLARSRKEDGALPLLAVPPSKRGEDGDAAYEYLGKLEKAKEDAERKRLLYVAATRACRRLHLLVGLAREEDSEGLGEFKPAARTMSGDLEQAFKALFALDPPSEVPARIKSSSRRQFFEPAIQRVPEGWAPPEPPAPMIARRPEETRPPSYVWASERARVLGLAVHRWLQEIAEEGLGAWPRERLAALRPRTQRILQFHGVPPDEIESLAADVETSLAGTLSDKRGRWMLEAHEGAASELPLSLQEDGRTRNLILDRTFVHKGERWIVDFKTSRHEGGNLESFLDEEERRHAPQLDRYRLAMAEREDRPIRTALYFPWHQAFREVYPGDAAGADDG